MMVAVVVVVVTSGATTYSNCGSGLDGRSVTGYLRGSGWRRMGRIQWRRFPYSEVLLLVLAVVLFVVLFVFIHAVAFISERLLYLNMNRTPQKPSVCH